MSNRFEQVDEIQPDAVNLVLAQTTQGRDGRVLIPASAFDGAGRNAIDSGVLPIVDAFRAAIKLANEVKLAIVVIDPDDVWHDTWGELYRDENRAD